MSTLLDCYVLLLCINNAQSGLYSSLCKSFDVKLRVLLEDGSYYLKADHVEEPRDESPTSGPFEKFADHSTIQTYLQTTCDQTVQK